MTPTRAAARRNASALPRAARRRVSFRVGRRRVRSRAAGIETVCGEGSNPYSDGNVVMAM